MLYLRMLVIRGLQGLDSLIGMLFTMERLIPTPLKSNAITILWPLCPQVKSSLVLG